MDLVNQLAKGIDTLDITMSSNQLAQLAELQNQLLKWTKAYNLTAITDPKQVMKLHLLDSLAIADYWPSPDNAKTKTLDVGTGAGFPGLPLAIALPNHQFHLLDSNAKKVRFIRQLIHHLGLRNVEAFHCRVQDHLIKDYDFIVSRAFASIADMVELTEPLLRSSGRWMAMKGAYAESEKSLLPDWVIERHHYRLSVPGLDAERCLVELARRND